MRESTLRYAAYAGFAGALFLVIVPGSEILARVQVAGMALPAAFAATVQRAADAPAPFLLGFVPFAAAAWLAASLARTSPLLGRGLFAVCVVLFALLNFGGQTDAQKFLLQQEDAEATLATGVVQFRSLGVVLLAFALRFLANRVPSATRVARRDDAR